MTGLHALAAMGLLCLLAAVVVLAAVRAAGRAAREEERADQAEATVEALHRANEGRAEAVTDLRKGKTPAQVKAGNDAKWGKR